MLWLALAARLSTAIPIHPVQWFDDSDWQKVLPKMKGSALELFRVTVTPEGQPLDCKVEVTSGTPELDKLTCQLVMERAHFKPAKWADGTLAYGVYRNNVLWADDPAFDYSRPVDVKFTLTRMPRGLRSPTSFSVDFAVDANGNRSSCQGSSKDQINPTLLSIACTKIISEYPAIPASNQAGVPVPSIQNVTVGFATN